jgi:hypothetical protein
MDDAKLVYFDALLGQTLIGFLDQSLLTSKRRPYAAFMMNEERLVVRSLLEFLTTVKIKIRTKEKRGIYARKKTTDTAHLKGLRHPPHQGVRNHPQGLHGVLMESLDILPVLHFILVIKGRRRARRWG